MIDNILGIAGRFDVAGIPVAYKECTAGHINNTYMVTFDCDHKTEKYILQRINTYVFKNPQHVMHNIVGVTTYIKALLEHDGGDAERGTLDFVKSKTGEYFYKDEKDGYWRMYRYVDNVISYSQAESPELFEKAGVAFGKFQLQLAGYDASDLYETIPDFHNTKKRFERFTQVVNSCTSERRNIASDAIEFILARGAKCSFVVDEIEAGRIPVRVTHNDTKLNNILMDEQTGEGVCIIDLDTIMPGSVLYDFGDSIRFGASSALEDEADLDKVFFRTDMFEAFARGYITASNGTLTAHEIESLVMGAYIITFETGMRFLTDYLENDVYFKTSYPDHNLVRARNQLKLVYDLETRMNEFEDIIKKII